MKDSISGKKEFCDEAKNMGCSGGISFMLENKKGSASIEQNNIGKTILTAYPQGRANSYYSSSIVNSSARKYTFVEFHCHPWQLCNTDKDVRVCT